MNTNMVGFKNIFKIICDLVPDGSGLSIKRVQHFERANVWEVLSMFPVCVIFGYHRLIILLVY